VPPLPPLPASRPSTPLLPLGDEVLIQQVNDDRAPVEITSKNGRAVLISADEWEAWQETAYLFRSPANARRLLDAAAALDAGQGRRVELDTAE
jgi:antitoxin YefM